MSLSKDQEGVILSIGEAKKLYRGQHIVMRVTELDERNDPLRGIVVVHETDPHTASQQFAEIDPGPDLPTHVYCIFSGNRPSQGIVTIPFPIE